MGLANQLKGTGRFRDSKQAYFSKKKTKKKKKNNKKKKKKKKKERKKKHTLYAICCAHSLTTSLTYTQPNVFGTMRSPTSDTLRGSTTQKNKKTKKNKNKKQKTKQNKTLKLRGQHRHIQHCFLYHYLPNQPSRS